MAKRKDFLIKVSLSQQQVAAPFQPLWAASSLEGLIRVSFGISRADFTAELEKYYPEGEIVFSHAPDSALTQLCEYLNAARHNFTVPLDLSKTTSFQQQVYQTVMQIPYGETRTYGEIARLIGKPNAARAVGAANGANPIPILIPCHRLVGNDGSLRGYGGAGGLTTKQFLLDLEISNPNT
jgi:methylated-DNA-[protein]-cysteine S-methyltransferase